ncbi:MAG TPA: OmpA family protein [Bacteroidales bacterium]|nr:OmpA family protein [Bacteroidales bacterium]
MKKIFFILFISVIYFNNNLQSQVSDIFKTNFILAETYLNDENYQDALPVFLFLDTLTPGNPNICFNVGVCYINSMFEKTKAIPYLEKAIENVSISYVGYADEITAPIFAFYYLGKAYMIANRIDEALTNFEKFAYYLTEKDEALLKDANRQIEMCYNAKKLMNNPVDIRIDNVGEPVNGPFPDYSPVISTDEQTIIFVSRREGTTCEKKDTDGKYFEDIYISTYDTTQKKWTDLKKIGTNINTCGHEAPISLSYDRKQLFIYKDDNGDGNIYVSQLKLNNWTSPDKLSSNINTKSWETHASLTSDGNTLYFTSNRPGGFGGRDIYMCEKLANGEWSAALNLGPQINTEYEEESPFILPDNVTLYFSSKGHESMGGFDIFTSTISDEGYWSTPENIGYPINTTDDDVFYVPTIDEQHAYYASAKEGGYGDLDIYRLSIIAQKKLVAHLKGIVFDEITLNPVGANIQVVDASTNEIVARLTSEETTGNYYVSLPIGKKYFITAEAENYYPTDKYLNIPDTITNPYYTEAIIMKKVPATIAIKNKKLIFENKEIVVGERIVLNNVFFDFDKYTLRPESVEELNKWVQFLSNNGTLKIEVSGHTDNKGTAEYNKTLSENRAMAVCNYFIENGIAKTRIKYKGYGFDQPIATNKTDEGRQKNRRTEIKIISKY